MKKQIITIALLFIFNLCHSQFGMSFEEVQINLKNGAVVNGFVRMNLIDLDCKDINKKHKKRILFSEIQTLKFTIYDSKNKNVKKEFTLENLELNSNNNKLSWVLAELIFEKEKIKIYGVYRLNGGGGSMGAGMGGQISVSNLKFGFSGNNYADYYCYLKKARYPKLIYQYTNFFKSFRVMAAECFKDCEELSNKINKLEFTKENIIDIGNFYNDKCN